MIYKKIDSVRSEMRFYNGKVIPSYSRANSAEVIRRYEEGVRVFSRRLREQEPNGLQRQKVMRELSKLVTDLQMYDASVILESGTAVKEIKDTPVLFPVAQLSDLLHFKPTKRTNSI